VGGYKCEQKGRQAFATQQAIEILPAFFFHIRNKKLLLKVEHFLSAIELACKRV
jgi:hypothetical protein